MTDSDNTAVEAVARLVPSLTGTLDTLAAISRQLHPPRLPVLVATIGTQDAILAADLRQLRAADWPPHLIGVRDQLGESADLALAACAGLRESVASGRHPVEAFRSLGHYTRAIEALYPLAAALPTVGRWFLNPPARDGALRLHTSRHREPRTGVLHAENDRGMRGGFSVYIPEDLDPTKPCPLVMALHGGSGHGRQFLWSWIREARGHGVIVVAPTSTARTWSLQEPEIDVSHLNQVLARIQAEWTVDGDHMLLTGMSDGGTFTLLSGLFDTSPFTHLAPIAASFHPMLVAISEPERIAGLPIYLVHGALDWMFPVQVARTANNVLTDAGASVNYREIADLSHTYPSEENERIVDWFLSR